MLAVTDEVYEHLTFDGAPHIPLHTLPGMAERTLTISSAGKTFSVTGWKIGWAVGPRALVGATQTAKQFLTFVSGAPFQHAIAYALGLPDDFYAGFRAGLQAKRDRLCAGLEAAGLDRPPPGGHLLRQRRTSARSARRTAMPSAWRCRSAPAWSRCPTVVFYDDKAAGRPLVRFAFCKRDEVIDEAAARLARLRS